MNLPWQSGSLPLNSPITVVPSPLQVRTVGDGTKLYPVMHEYEAVAPNG